MEHDEEEELPSPSSSLGYLMLCRICHEEEDGGRATMESPCGCSGSLKYAHRRCVQRWCDEKGTAICEICLQNFEPGYTMPPKKTPVVETAVTIRSPVTGNLVTSGNGDLELLSRKSRPKFEFENDSDFCNPVQFTIMLLAWHLVAVVTVEAAAHCTFSLLAMYLLRAAGILLPLCVVMRLIRIVQSGQEQQYGLQLLEHQRRNASTI
ncbi:E3 ubiquitin-protein ligase MARCH2 [Zea mays]|uniref:E3 ubiquitin-protein ligase MARCH2 n=1 Tax=Zea mays TaxID=4577 RepID=A0A3L6DP21_MAIZE|nr:E3 ubiquitin-protein ligase MARCH2 [Zea mays]